MRTRDIGQRAIVRTDVGQEQPGLHRRMECVGVKLDLRVRRRVGASADDRLDIIEWRDPAAGNISHDALPARTVEHSVQVWYRGQHRRPHRDTPGYRVSLLMLTCLQFGFE